MKRIRTGRKRTDVSNTIREILEELNRAAGLDARVLISGDTEVGKEILALRIHGQSARRQGPFVATTGTDMRGNLADLLKQSAGGTLFVDEIGDLDSSQQDALLRFLESDAGDVRIIAASGRSLHDEVVLAGTFNETLFYRLNVIHVVIPEHSGDDEDAWKPIEETATAV